MMTEDPAHSRSPNVEALRERVDNQGVAIRALADDTATSFRDLRTEVSRSFGDFAASLKGLDAKLDAQAKSVNDSQRPQYLGLFGAMIAAVGLSVTIIQWQTSLHDKPVDDKLSSLRDAIADLTKNTASAFSEAAKGGVSQREYQQTQDYQAKIGDIRTQMRDQIRQQMQAQLDRVTGDVVSRRELDFHWSAEAKADEEIRAALVSTNKRLDELAPASDVIKRLSDREHELEMRVFGTKPGSP